ncbi:hypothetical protein BG006_007036 [Podila minutissima]|uniref:Uncharacterized protein n=1 Tax=Podila minutissima TaxID=64525 RepID=A0A9P5VL67_9FUNG|nr:hypothetical protein BG006_007036 [Podila minutissima]
MAGAALGQSHGRLQDFLNDPQVQAAAPHLVDQINSQGIQSVASYDTGGFVDPTGGLITQAKIPLLNDVIEIVTTTIFSSKEADWGRLEQAKLKAIQDHGAEAVEAISDLNSLDIHRALLIVNTIYDSVIHLPATNKVKFSSKTRPASVWDYIGFGLIKSSDAVRNFRNVITPAGTCETTDTSYLKGVEELVYYSSLSDGLAGGTLAASPPSSTVKSLGLFRVVSAIGKLAIELHMAQGVAQLAELDPMEERVRAMVYLALTAENPLSTQAQTAREINNLITRNMTEKIPDAALKAVEEHAALILITKGAGRGDDEHGFLSSIPVLSNIFAFSRDVLGARNVGDVLKFVFCPVPASSLVPGTASGATQDGADRNQRPLQTQQQIQQLQQQPQVQNKVQKSAVSSPEADKDEVEMEDVNEDGIESTEQGAHGQQKVLQRPDPERVAAASVEEQLRNSDGNEKHEL